MCESVEGQAGAKQPAQGLAPEGRIDELMLVLREEIDGYFGGPMALSEAPLQLDVDRIISAVRHRLLAAT